MNDAVGSLLIFIPLALLLLLANLGERRRLTTPGLDPWTFLTYAILIGLYVTLAFAGVAYAVFQTLPQFAEMAKTTPALQAGDSSVLAWGFILPSLAGLILLLPPVRRLCARFLPIDPNNRVHAVALSMSMLVLINMIVTLGIGLDALSDMMSAAEEESGASAVTVASIWLQQIGMALLGFVGVGWLVRRSGAETLRRLGLVIPTARQVLVGIGIALILVSAVIAIQALAASFQISLDEDVEKLTEQLLGPLFTSWFGILTLGLSAALGEETLMRGAAQPRLGLIYTAFLFALLHSNYGITLSTVIVFGVGIVLGLVRMRFNTSTSMVVHATYNISLGLLAYFAINLPGMK